MFLGSVKKLYSSVAFDLAGDALGLAPPKINPAVVLPAPPPKALAVVTLSIVDQLVPL